MAPCLAELATAALDPEVEPASAGEAKLLLRCVGALLRKHSLLLPELAPKMIETLLAGCGPNRCGHCWPPCACCRVVVLDNKEDADAGPCCSNKEYAAGPDCNVHTIQSSTTKPVTTPAT